MLIGIDASRAYIKGKTGTETYSYEVLTRLLKLKEAQKHQFRVYVKEPSNQTLPNVQEVVIDRKKLWTQVGLARELRQNPVDVLWIPAHTLPVLRPKKIKTVVTIHGLEYEFLPEYYKFPQKLWLNKSTEYAVKYADRLIAVSHWTKKQLVDRLGARENKIKVIYEGIGERFLHIREYGVNKTMLRQVKHKYSLIHKYILFIGTIQPRKNLERLIEAFSKLTNAEVDLVIGGSKGWMDEAILAAPKKYGVANRVKFIGRVADADLPTVYAGAEMFVWPSLMEGFGLPILEAFACGLPVITSDRGALSEVAGRGLPAGRQAALIVNPESVEEIARAMELVLGEPDLRQGLREKGYLQMAKFSWEKAAKATLETLTRW